jgi:hypothetical protein
VLISWYIGFKLSTGLKFKLKLGGCV